MKEMLDWLKWHLWDKWWYECPIHGGVLSYKKISCGICRDYGWDRTQNERLLFIPSPRRSDGI